MRVTVRLFAGLRERAGAAEHELELAAGATAADVWPALAGRLGKRPEGVLVAVNKRYVSDDASLSDGDEVALIPPVSGGAFQIGRASCRERV
jgi:molybdopterin converting factor subunit 1